ncbi:hypothetical protein O0I10_005168 [Lichtheimia ornata]|uniref:Uncharacterized protein n=1 Tax=Lichtheimia ornata TaxID=688661 RepID=A0AAD7V573_9FUNG|nr:uncharacterized protein O0I10_005168 [Lichtheimia ornata]KAJ8659129.1 hypothetical protein O0I10_005168 [Lichtheimia ornata]
MRTFFALSAAAAFLMAANAQQADPVELTDSFSLFRWSGDSDAQAVETFSINLDKPARIQVTDFKNRGDTFKIYDNGNLIGETSEVESEQDDSVYAATPEEALENDQFSKGTFDIAEGEHSITIKASGPYDAGTAAIRLIQEPSQNQQLHKKKSGKKGGKSWDDDDDDDEWDSKKGGKWDDDDDDEWDSKKGGKWDDDDDDEWDSKKGGKKGGKWDDDDDDEWDSKKGGKKGGWGDDDEGWGGKKGGKWDDDDEGWGGKKGGWDDDEGWDGKKGGWDDDESWGGKGDWKKYKEVQVDPNHTVTLTTTMWIVERPTAVPIKTVEKKPKWEDKKKWGGY